MIPNTTEISYPKRQWHTAKRLSMTIAILICKHINAEVLYTLDCMSCYIVVLYFQWLPSGSSINGKISIPNLKLDKKFC